MKSRLHLPWILTLTGFLAMVGAVKVTVNTPSVHVTRGGTALLPCSFRTTAALNRLNIIWTVTPLVEPKHPLQVIAYEQGQIVESLTEYLGRVKFAFRPTQDAGIFINHTRVSDTGTYQCTVINPPDGATPNIGLVGLTVLVPPSIPDCSSDGHGQEGGSIHLFCSVVEGIPAPRFRWEKIPPDAQLLNTRQEDFRGSTTLTNITLGTSGVYRCTATNQLGSQSCAIELHIHAGGIGAMGIFAAITVTLIMGLVLLALLALVLNLHQQSRGKWRHAELYHPARVDNLCATKSPDTAGSSLITRPGPHIPPAWPSSPIPPAWPSSPIPPAWPSSPIPPAWPSSPIPPAWPCSHILYSVRRSQISLSPVPETPDIRSPFPPLSSGTDSITESEDEDNTSDVPPPVYRSSLYSVNSGFLV